MMGGGRPRGGLGFGRRVRAVRARVMLRDAVCVRVCACVCVCAHARRV